MLLRTLARSSLLLSTVLLLPIAACGAEDGDETASSVVDEYANRQYGESGSSPLSSFMGFDDPEKMSAQAREMNKKTELSIADCMRAEGFDYIVNVQATSFESPDYDMTQREYAEKWGFGMTTTMSADGSTVDDAPGMETPPEIPDDPNQKIVEAMSESERRAYEIALYGSSMSEPTDDEESDDMSDAPQGCQAKAYQSESETTDATEQLGTVWEEMSKRIEADKTVKAAAKEYRACMTDAGYPKVKDLDDVYDLVDKKMSALWGDVSSTDGDMTVETSVDSSDFDEESGSSDGGSTIDPKELAAAQKFERKLAVADLECRAGYLVVYEKVSAGYEEQMIDEHRDLLEQVRDSGGF